VISGTCAAVEMVVFNELDKKICALQLHRSVIGAAVKLI